MRTTIVRRAVRVLLAPVALMVAAWVTTARADRIALRGGGEIRGVVVEDAKHPDKVAVQTDTGARPILFNKDQVVRIVAEPSALDDYLKKRDEVGSDAEAQYQFGLWCEENKLTGPAEVHFRLAVEADANHAGAHRKLGHVQSGDRWMTYDELKQSQGLIKYKGRWVSKQEKDAQESRKALSAQQVAWVRRLRILRQQLYYGKDTQRQDAEAQIIAIRDPAAAEPLLQTFGGDPAEVRTLLDSVLSAIPGPDSAGALLQRVFAEPEPAIRSITLDALARRKEPSTVPTLLGYLKSKDPEVIGRAAWALAALNVVEAVPKLVPHLVRVEHSFVMVPGTYLPGSNPGGITAGFVSPSPSSSAVGPTLGGTAYPVLTPPAVAPGAVAYGATQVPLQSLGMNGVQLGTGGGGGRPVAKMITVVHQNTDVLEALVKLTGVNFGYDMDAWKKWTRVGLRPVAPPARRVPEP